MDQVDLYLVQATDSLQRAIQNIRQARELMLAEVRRHREGVEDGAARVASLAHRQLANAEDSARKALEGLC